MNDFVNLVSYAHEAYDSTKSYFDRETFLTNPAVPKVSAAYGRHLQLERELRDRGTAVRGDGLDHFVRETATL